MRDKYTLKYAQQFCKKHSEKLRIAEEKFNKEKKEVIEFFENMEQHVKDANKVVDSWPKWKKDIAHLTSRKGENDE